MKNRWIIIPITLLCLGTQASVDAADVSQPFAHQELQNQANQKRYGEGGFKRLLNEGFSCENTRIPYVP